LYIPQVATEYESRNSQDSNDEDYQQVPGAVLGKIFGGEPGPSSFGRQQWLREITIEPLTSTSSRTTVSNYPEKHLGARAIFGGACASLAPM